MKPVYIITRYDKNGKVIWERLSRNKQSYYSTIGSINSFWGKNDTVTLEEVGIASVSLIEQFPAVEEVEA
jgi:hypothetical protein